MTEAGRFQDRSIEDYRTVAESSMTWPDDVFESSMTVMLLPVGLQRNNRTLNQIERLNKELKRRFKVIGVFPNDESPLRLMGSVLIETHDTMMTDKSIFIQTTWYLCLNMMCKTN